jgi:hypothetical protein
MSQRGRQENLRGRYVVKIFTSVHPYTNNEVSWYTNHLDVCTSD